MDDQRPDDCLAAAIRYTMKGLFVFPVSGKRPLTRNGLKDATLDPSQITWWWDKHPDAGVAIACEPSQLVVFDCDGKHGIETFKKFIDGHGPLPQTPLVKTPRDGMHVYMNVGDNQPFTSSISFLPGVDLRSRGGYVVAPPSLHENGVRYRWVPGRSI